MKILAHRGVWEKPEEKNTRKAIQRAIEEGFGIETDLRDCRGELFVSHDPANGEEMTVDELLSICAVSEAPIALNIKADGIQKMISAALKQPVRDYFFFDMSNPEMVLYKKFGMPYFTRQSDIEKECVLYEDALGVWVDGFITSEWIDETILRKHLDAGKRVSIISDEIHGRDNTRLWSILQKSGLSAEKMLLLCTDEPIKARRFFGSSKRDDQ